LIVNPNTVLAFTVPCQCFKAVSRRNTQVIEHVSGVQLIQLSGRDAPQILRTSSSGGSGVLTIKDVVCARVLKGANHGSIIARYSCYLKSVDNGISDAGLLSKLKQAALRW
jgi:hypothetical protein